MADPTPESPTAEQLRATIAAAIDLFKTSNRWFVGQAKQQQFLAIHGLVAVTFQQVDAAVLLIDQNMIAAAMANVRSAMEYAITVQWLHHQPDSIEDFINKSQKSARNVLADGQKLGWNVPEQMAYMLSEQIPNIDARIGHFEQMCNAFDPALYVFYRSLSGMVHPSMDAVGKYVVMREDGSTALLSEAHSMDSYSLLWCCALSAILALACREDLVRTKPNKSAVAKIAGAVSIPPLLPLREPQPKASKRSRSTK